MLGHCRTSSAERQTTYEIPGKNIALQLYIVKAYIVSHNS